MSSGETGSGFPGLCVVCLSLLGLPKTECLSVASSGYMCAATAGETRVPPTSNPLYCPGPPSSFHSSQEDKESWSQGMYPPGTCSPQPQGLCSQGQTAARVTSRAGGLLAPDTFRWRVPGAQEPKLEPGCDPASVYLSRWEGTATSASQLVALAYAQWAGPGALTLPCP